ncbi:Mss4-like protein [Myxozyma melibiosi]|uniref:Mss4-like protein n=1 Tax=Myxozyma melibiosi TaxID=54550 RepID=A0ABR1F9W9_9ASCO
MPSYKGSCACGAVKIEAEIDDPTSVFICHCNACKIRHGPFNSVIVIPEDKYKIVEGKDNLSVWAYTADSGNPLPKSFCKTCGVALFATAVPLPGMIIATAPTFTEAWNSGELRPSAQADVAQKLSWIDTLAELKAM